MQIHKRQEVVVNLRGCPFFLIKRKTKLGFLFFWTVVDLEGMRPLAVVNLALHVHVYLNRVFVLSWSI